MTIPEYKFGPPHADIESTIDACVANFRAMRKAYWTQKAVDKEIPCAQIEMLAGTWKRMLSERLSMIFANLYSASLHHHSHHLH